eukprot:3699272-Rhodomonas_salina.2
MRDKVGERYAAISGDTDAVYADTAAIPGGSAATGADKAIFGCCGCGSCHLRVEPCACACHAALFGCCWRRLC